MRTPKVLLMLAALVFGSAVVAQDSGQAKPQTKTPEPKQSPTEISDEMRAKIARSYREDIDSDIPLAVAIERANQRFPDAQPLTESEVIAAVLAIKLEHPDVSDAVYKIYLRVANEKVLPKGMYFSHIPAWKTPYGYFHVDWRDLSLRPLPVGTRDESIGFGFTYRIRARFISSRPLTEAEKEALGQETIKVKPGD